MNRPHRPCQWQAQHLCLPPKRLGSETSDLYDTLKWALEVKRVLDNALNTTLGELQTPRREIQALPDTGMPGIPVPWHDTDKQH